MAIKFRLPIGTVILRAKVYELQAQRFWTSFLTTKEAIYTSDEMKWDEHLDRYVIELKDEKDYKWIAIRPNDLKREWTAIKLISNKSSACHSCSFKEEKWQKR